MGTSYYRTRDPITSIRAERAGGHVHIGVWVNHGKSGTLIVRKDEVAAMLLALCDTDLEAAMHTHWGGSERGAVVTQHDTALTADTVLVSEYGEALTVREIRARDGAKREDGMPTELFGYEDGAGQSSETQGEGRKEAGAG